MKGRIAVVGLLCLFLWLFCGCIAKPPEHLPGTKAADVNFVWVCEDPFSYFVVDKEELSKGYPCLKGYITKENQPLCFYIHEDLNVITCLQEEKAWKDNTGVDTACGHTKYYEVCFVFEVEYDYANFFGGELPELRFEKMTKEDFLEQYGEIENVSELLQLEPNDVDESVQL